MPAAPLIALNDGIIFTGEAMVEGHALLLKDGHIADIIRNGQIPAEAEKASYPDCILVPGYIDVQVNGGGNVLFNNDPSTETCLSIAKAHRRFGTTRLLPTIITDTPEITQKAITAARAARKVDPGILGVHIEGPHLGQPRRGIHKSDYIRVVSASDLNLYRRASDEIMLMTIAPETVTPQQIKVLHEQGVIISIGHTSASHDQIRAALKAGASCFTHLYNGMGKPGAEAVPADVALKDRNSWCSIIMDGYHVRPELFQLALRNKPHGKLFLVSDAMPPAASDNPQSFTMYGEVIHVEKGRCVNNEARLAGSSITLSDAVRHCIDLGVAAEEALRMASTYPAAFLGLDSALGKLLPGFVADVAVLDAAFTPQATWVAGRLI